MSLVLNGSSYLDGPIGNLPTVGPMSISCWVKLPISGEAWAVTLTDSSKALVDILVGVLPSGRAALSVRSLNGPPSAESATSVSANTWCHLVATIDAVDQRLMTLDGVSGQPVTDSTTPAGIDRIWFGAIGWVAPIIAFTGRIAEVGVWSRVLDATDRARLAGGAPPTALSSGLAGYYPLRADATPVMGPTLTATGAPSYDAADHPPMFQGAGRLLRGQATAAGAGAGLVQTGGALAGVAPIAGEVY